MTLRIGIVGLPNVGKSTILNALTGAQNARAENFPFCTVEPNHAVVALPDPRVDVIAGLTHPNKVTHTSVEFVDIAGLVRNANRGEGLGNQFLAAIGETDAILEVVRCFADENVAHVEGDVDPVRDIEILETELLQRDIQMLENRVAGLSKQVRNEKELQGQVAAGKALLEHLDSGRPASTFDPAASEGAQVLFREMRFLTRKPVIYCANIDDDPTDDTTTRVAALQGCARDKGSEAIVMAARMEEDLIGMDPADRTEFLDASGLDKSALDRLIHAGYRALGLISFFTIQSNQVQAWTVRQGCRAPQAAGAIHTDFEKGFIRAEVIHYDDFVEHGGEAACKAAGAVHTEGKDYEVRDGDVIRFHFSS